MTAQQGVERLEPALTKDARDRYCFICPKVFVMLRMLGRRAPLKFVARDRLAFRINTLGITVEEVETGRVRMRFTWGQVEALAAGERETENGALFQG